MRTQRRVLSSQLNYCCILPFIIPAFIEWLYSLKNAKKLKHNLILPIPLYQNNPCCFLHGVRPTICYRSSTRSLTVVVGDHHKGNTQASEVTHSLSRIIMVTLKFYFSNCIHQQPLFLQNLSSLLSVRNYITSVATLEVLVQCAKLEQV